MLKQILSTVAVMALSSFALAQQISQMEAAAAMKNAPASTTCAATFTSGSGHNFTKYCVTANGNITQFSRDIDEYINVGLVSEGYGICDLTSKTSYTDYASSDSGNWLAATFTSTATQALSTRKTSDGIWQITNQINQVAASATSPAAARVTMKVKNLTGVSRQIALVRFADTDFQEGSSVDTKNDFDFTLDYAAGLEGGFQTGLSLTNGTSSFGHDAFSLNTFHGPDPCATLPISTQPFVGDGGIGQVYLITIPSLGTKSVTMTYKPI